MNYTRCTLHAIRCTLHAIRYTLFLVLLTFLFYTLYAARYTLTFAAEEKQKAAVTVNGFAITERDVDETVEQIIAAQPFHREATPERKERFRKDALERLINIELLYQEALRLGMEIPDKEVRKIFADQKAQFKAKEFSSFLKKMGLTEDGFRKRIRKVMLVDRIIKAKIDEPSKVSDPEAKDYYEANSATFVEPEKVRLSEIFIYIPPDADDAARAKKTETAREALGRIKEGGDFCKLASQYSEDELKTRCGDMGFVHKGRLDETLEKEVWNMKEGEVKMVAVEKGLMLVKFIERKPERRLSFDEVKERLKKQLADAKRKKIREEYINSLKAKATIIY